MEVKDHEKGQAELQKDSSKLKGIPQRHGVSVIITAHKRRSFLKQAVSSVLNQSYVPPNSELIVITDFEPDFELKSEAYEVKHVKVEGGIGEFYYNGIELAKNDIIAFLDDDDLWVDGKLKRVEQAFSLDNSICYYHNLMTFINKQGLQLNRPNPIIRSMKSAVNGCASEQREPLVVTSQDVLNGLPCMVTFNMSSVAVRKSFLERFMNDLKRIKALPDGFFFFSCIISGGKLYMDNSILTKYRVHELSMQGYTDLVRKSKVVLDEIDTIKILIKNAATIAEPLMAAKLKEWLESSLNFEEFRYIFFSSGKKTLLLNKIAKIMDDRYLTTKAKFELLVAGIMFLLNKKLSHYMYTKIASL